MVNYKKIYNTALIKYRLGILLIWLGVLTWLPFIMLRIAGESPSLFWYLPFHLAGVVGGSRLRGTARRELNLTPPGMNILRMLGHGMIVSGILVWAPYFYLKAIAHRPVEVMDFLPYHLAGVLGGMLFLGISFVASRKSTPKID